MPLPAQHVPLPRSYSRTSFNLGSAVIRNVLVALAYIATARLGLLLAFEQTNATAVWPPAGIALAACLVFGYRVWPGIFLGALIANISVLATSPESLVPVLLVSSATATGNTLEALAGSYLIRRSIFNSLPFDRTQDTLSYILFGAIASPLISATIGSVSFCLYSGGWSRFVQIWLTWWLGDAVGILVVAPLLLTWDKRSTLCWNWVRAVEAASLLALLLMVEVIIFHFNFPLEYLVFPVLFWTAFRFGQFETAVTVTLVMLSFLVWTIRGAGPFTVASLNSSLLFLQSYLGVASASTLLLSTLISARNRVAGALRASEEKFRSIFENAPVGIFHSTMDGRFSSVNETLAAMFSYPSPKEMTGDITDIAEQLFVCPEQRRAIINRARDSLNFVRDEITYRRKDGSQFVANLYVRVLRDSCGDSPDLEGFVEDVTERKRAEERLGAYQGNLEKLVRARTAELQETNEQLTREIEERNRAELMLVEREAQYHDLVESANCVILRWLPDGRITFFNRFAQHFFGYREEEITNCSIMDTIVPRRDSTGHELASMAADIVAQPEAYASNVNENIRKNGDRVWVAWTNKPILDADGSIEEILSIGIDITRLVHTEQELRRTLEELAHAKERAEAADQLKSAFLATMSHELRTPLNSIIGFTGILLQGLGGPINDEQAKQLSMVKNSANHLLSLISDVLDISKIEAGQMTVDQESFNLGESVLKVVQSVRPLVEKKNLKLSCDVAEDVGRVVGDTRRVEQILLNLLSNAIKFTEQGGISVRCVREGSDYLTTVTDSGIGINGEDLERLFRPFHQIDTGLSRKYEGTGLGLSISRKLVELMGGGIRVESRPGQGSTFGFTLPLERNPA
ncbi:MAG: MASE1 domain-containing protein [Desulfuromonadales bacterium]|nr:MASE1 domain-containing protein [Desulfuromonadales bacterium]